MRGRLAIGTGLTIGALALTGCTDIEENNVCVAKDVVGNVEFHQGPDWKVIGANKTTTMEWDGRRVIDLPLARGSEAQQNYLASDGAIQLDAIVIYQLGREDAQRSQWFVQINEPEVQFPRAVEGVVRTTVSLYTKAEVLNSKEAVKNGKLPWFRQAQLDLAGSTINKEYGVDGMKYAVWPGNVSLLRGEVESDLQRQRNVIIRGAEAKAQGWYAQADDKRAEVDTKYAEFITQLTDEQRKYLSALDMVRAVRTVAREQGQQLNVHLFVE